MEVRAASEESGESRQTRAALPNGRCASGAVGGTGDRTAGRVPPPEEGGLAVGGGAAVEIDSSGTCVCMSFFPAK